MRSVSAVWRCSPRPRYSCSGCGGAALDPSAHVYPAIVWTLYGYYLFHLALVMGLYLLARHFAGHLSPGYDIDLRNTALFWYFSAFEGVLAMATIHLSPLAG